jgi:hypothetical protein
MSPSKKKTAKKAAKSSSASRKSPAKKAAKKAKRTPKKKAATKKKAAKKKSAKKAAKAPAKKASQKAKKKAARSTKASTSKTTRATTKAPAKKAAQATAKKAAKATAPAKGSSAPAAKGGRKKKKKKKADVDEVAAPKRARPKKPIAPTGPCHPKLGYKWTCFSCGAKFYDLLKEDPICPKCEADQRDRPPEEPKVAAEPPKPKVVRPMAQLLDDEESTTDVDDDVSIKDASGAEEMFDDADEVSLELDDTDLVDRSDLDD